MAPSFSQFGPNRIRSWIIRLPFCTRLLLLSVWLFWLAARFISSVQSWGALVPSAIVALTSMHKLNTYPVCHVGTIQPIVTSVILTPLAAGFEAEHGTLATLALFAGPFASLPAAVYIFIDYALLRSDGSVQGGGVWAFLLLACQAIKTWRAHPSFHIGPYQIPTYTTPLLLILAAYLLLPGGSSILIHLCGAAVGYAFELGYLKFLIPPEKALRWIERKLDLLGRLPRYVSVDQKTYGRFGVLDTLDLSIGFSGARSDPVMPVEDGGGGGFVPVASATVTED